MRTIQKLQSFSRRHRKMQQCSILNISLEIQKRILRYLLKSTRPLVLGPDASSSSVDYHAEIEPQILQVSSQLYQLGRLILYGENIFTISSLSSSSAISYDLDSRLTTILGKYRLLISRIILQIDRAEQLWTVFPLLAKILAELPLKTFMISIVEKGQGAKKGRAALTAASENTSNFARDEARGDGFHEERDITDTTLTVEKSGNKTTLHGEKVSKAYFPSP